MEKCRICITVVVAPFTSRFVRAWCRPRICVSANNLPSLVVRTFFVLEVPVQVRQVVDDHRLSVDAILFVGFDLLVKVVDVVVVLNYFWLIRQDPLRIVVDS